MPRCANLISFTIIGALCAQPAAAAGPVSEDVPVPGGTAAMARALGIDPPPDRARFVAEIARLTHPGSDVRVAPRTKAATAATTPSTSPAETVPIPLTAAVWSQAVFHRTVAPQALVAAIVADARASHLCYGLAALDDETLQFLVDHPGVITRLYDEAAPAFAAFGSSLHVHANRVVVPGGPAAAELWDAAAGRPSSSPDAFIRALFEQDGGRLASLYDAIAGLDAPRRAFALGLSMKDAAVRLRRFKALVAANRSAIPQWQPMKLPFTRPLNDVATLLSRVKVQPDGSPSPPAQRSAWTWIFAGLDVPARGPAQTAPDEGPIDAAWLAQLLVAADTRERGERLDQLAFGQRTFGQPDAASNPDALIAIRALPRFRMLMLTLERSGVRRPAVYAAAVRRAQEFSGLDRSRLFVGLGQYQGALALIARMAAVRTLDPPAAELLVAGLSAVPLNGDGRYAGALAKWIQQELVPAVKSRLNEDAAGALTFVDEVLLQGLAGAAPRDPVTVEWEGDVYRVDIAASERRRLRRIRDRQGRPSIDEALTGAHDDVMADALMAWAYAVSIADADSPVLLTGLVTRRHDFGFAPADRALRLRTPWALPRQEIAVGVPWHLTGSLLGLDVALAGLSLRRAGGDRAIEAPTLSSNERDAFAASVALLNPYDLRDRDRDAIAAAVALGRTRVAALAEDSSRADELSAEIGMDGWRRRALQWMLLHEPDRVGSIFSMTELLSLGRGLVGDLDPWGMSAIVSAGCLCTRLAASNQWTSLVGRPQLGLMAATVADLNLHVAVTLHDLQLPAAVAKSVLSAAVQDFIDETRPTDFNDWLTLVRSAQSVPRERIEDYVAVATADGPLVRVEKE